MASAPQNTSSTHRSAIIQGTHQFHIVGYGERRPFGRVKDTGSARLADPFIKSGAFQVGNYTWDLVCALGAQGHLTSITLELLSTDVTKDVIAAASLQIDDPLGMWPPAVWRSNVAHRFSENRFHKSWNLSLPDAFRGHERRYLSDDDSLTILCTIDILRDDDNDAEAAAAAARKCCVAVVPAPTIAGDFRKLFLLLDKYPGSSDVTFLVEDTEFRAHRLVLAMRSPVFARELFGFCHDHMIERTTQLVRIDDMPASTFRVMLQFIYSDELPMNPNNDVESTGIREGRVAMARDLLVAADRYDLDRLRLMCESILCENINMSTVLTTLLLVRGRLRCRQLEDCCINYITSDPDVYEALKATKEFEELKETCGSFIIELTDRVATHNINTIHPASSSRRQPAAKSTSMCNTSEVVHGTHKFKIQDFSSVQRRHGVITSDIFNVGGYDWTIKVYPSGNWTSGPRDGEQNISVYLNLCTDPGAASVRSSKRFRVDDPNGKSPSTVVGSEDIFTEVSESWGFRKFITLDSAKSRYIGHDGSLTIYCDLDVHKEACTSSNTAEPMVVVPPSNIAWHLELLMLSEQWSDVTFLVEDSQIHAHWLIIAVRSPLLFENVVASITTNNRVLRVDHMKADVLRAVLHFVYTDDLLPVDDDAVVAGEMLAAACRFRLERMRDMCENLLAHILSKGNVFSTLELALGGHCEELKLYCRKFISSAIK